MADKEKNADKEAKKAAKAAKKAEKKAAKEEKKNKKNGELAGAEEPKKGGKLGAIIVTLLIVIVWLGIIALLVKLDVGGFGSTVLKPLIKDVPYLNLILPETPAGEGEDPAYPYATLEEAIDRIKELEVELQEAKDSSSTGGDKIKEYEEEIKRLKVYEENQATFDKVKTEFYDEVVFGDKAPKATEYIKYYESIEPAQAASLYKQAVAQDAEDKEITDYANTYSNMKPAQAAKIMESMTDDLDLVVKILKNMDVEARAKVLGAMNAEIAAQVTKKLEP